VAAGRQESAQSGLAPRVGVGPQLHSQGVGQEMVCQQLSGIAALVPRGFQGQAPGGAQEGHGPGRRIEQVHPGVGEPGAPAEAGLEQAVGGAHEVTHEGRRGGIDPIEIPEGRVLGRARGLLEMADHGGRDPLTADLLEALPGLLAVGAGHHSQAIGPQVGEEREATLAQLAEPGQGVGHRPEVLRLLGARREAQQEEGRPARLGESEPEEGVDALGLHPGWISW
jgi:hypothetical protein